MAFFPDTALAYLQRAHTEGRLAHAYLITGSDDCDREGFAVRFLQLVNQSTRSTLRDFQNEGVRVVAPESKSRRIKIDQMRELERSLYLGSADPGKVKAGVIVDAERVSTEGVNAFLKTLEEPPDRSLLLLLTRHPEQLLDTVRSRCIRVPLIPVPGSAPPLTTNQRALLDALHRHFSGKLTVGRALGLMREFARLLAEIKAEICAAFEKEHKEEIARYKQTTEGDWLKKREDYFKALTEARYQQQRECQMNLLLLWFGDILRHQAGSARLDLTDYAKATRAAASRLSAQSLQRRLESVESLCRHLATNVNEALALEVTFLGAFGPEEDEE
jgi:DNA polymerase-3 subunit delta'